MRYSHHCDITYSNFQIYFQTRFNFYTKQTLTTSCIKHIIRQINFHIQIYVIWLRVRLHYFLLPCKFCSTTPPPPLVVVLSVSLLSATPLLQFTLSCNLLKTEIPIASRFFLILSASIIKIRNQLQLTIDEDQGKNSYKI